MSSDICPICLNEFSGQSLAALSNCSHVFCFDCIYKWSQYNNLCPIDNDIFEKICAVEDGVTGCSFNQIEVRPVKRRREVERYDFTSYCEVCKKNKGGYKNILLLCDACDLAYHLNCLFPPLRRVPDGEWYCPTCRKIMAKKSPPKKILQDEIVVGKRKRGRPPKRPQVKYVCTTPKKESNLSKAEYFASSYALRGMPAENIELETKSDSSSSESEKFGVQILYLRDSLNQTPSLLSGNSGDSRKCPLSESESNSVEKDNSEEDLKHESDTEKNDIGTIPIDATIIKTENDYAPYRLRKKATVNGISVSVTKNAKNTATAKKPTDQALQRRNNSYVSSSNSDFSTLNSSDDSESSNDMKELESSNDAYVLSECEFDSLKKDIIITKDGGLLYKSCKEPDGISAFPKSDTDSAKYEYRGCPYTLRKRSVNNKLKEELELDKDAKQVNDEQTVVKTETENVSNCEISPYSLRKRDKREIAQENNSKSSTSRKKDVDKSKHGKLDKDAVQVNGDISVKKEVPESCDTSPYSLRKRTSVSAQVENTDCSTASKKNQDKPKHKDDNCMNGVISESNSSDSTTSDTESSSEEQEESTSSDTEYVAEEEESSSETENGFEECETMIKPEKKKKTTFWQSVNERFKEIIHESQSFSPNMRTYVSANKQTATSRKAKCNVPLTTPIEVDHSYSTNTSKTDHTYSVKQNTKTRASNSENKSSKELLSSSESDFSDDTISSSSSGWTTTSNSSSSTNTCSSISSSSSTCLSDISYLSETELNSLKSDIIITKNGLHCKSIKGLNNTSVSKSMPTKSADNNSTSNNSSESISNSEEIISKEGKSYSYEKFLSSLHRDNIYITEDGRIIVKEIKENES